MARSYGVRCIFKRRGQPHYEERITLWRANSFEAAIERAEAEAVDYQEGSESEYMHMAQVYELAAGRVGDGSEVFSLIRDSSLGPKEYITRFFDTGSERQGKVE
jgi:hypothetical protein